MKLIPNDRNARINKGRIIPFWRGIRNVGSPDPDPENGVTNNGELVTNDGETVTNGA